MGPGQSTGSLRTHDPTACLCLSPLDFPPLPPHVMIPRDASSSTAASSPLERTFRNPWPGRSQCQRDPLSGRAIGANGRWPWPESGRRRDSARPAVSSAIQVMYQSQATGVHIDLEGHRGVLISGSQQSREPHSLATYTRSQTLQTGTRRPSRLSIAQACHRWLSPHRVCATR